MADPAILIDPHGRVVPLADAVRTHLADRAGRYLLLPSAPDLLLAVRSPQGGGASPPGGVFLSGDLAAFPLGDLLGFVHQMRTSGVLRVASGGTVRTVIFRDGSVRGASSQLPSERVGQVALRLGLLTEGALAEAASMEQRTGRALIARGYLSAGDLWKALREQVAVVFHALLVARRGVFWMSQGEPVEMEGGLSLDTQGLLVDAIRRIDEMELFRQAIPHSGVYIQRREPRHAVALEPEEERLLSFVDGWQDLSSLARAAQLSEFEATKIVYRLLQGGWAEVVEPPAEAGGGEGDAARFVAESMNEALREIAGAVASHGQGEPFLEGAEAFLADPSSRHAALWAGLSPGPDGALDVEALLASLEAHAPPGADDFARARLLLDAMRELMVLYLFEAGERLPREVDEALSRSVKERVATVDAQVSR